jgi:hypothetical protein
LGASVSASGRESAKPAGGGGAVQAQRTNAGPRRGGLQAGGVGGTGVERQVQHGRAGQAGEGLDRGQHRQAVSQNRRFDRGEQGPQFAFQGLAVRQAARAEGMTLGRFDLGLGETGEGQGVEVGIGQGVGGNAQHVAEEAGADHGRGEGGAQVVGVAQGVLGQFDLVGGEAARLQDHVVDRRRLGQRALAHGVATRGVEVGAGLGQAEVSRGAEGRDQQAVGGLGGRDRRGGGGMAQGLAAQAQGRLGIGEGGDQARRAQAVLAGQAMGDRQGGRGFRGQWRAQGGGAHAALGQAAQHGLALLGEGGIGAEHGGGSALALSAAPTVRAHRAEAASRPRSPAAERPWVSSQSPTPARPISAGRSPRSISRAVAHRPTTWLKPAVSKVSPCWKAVTSIAARTGAPRAKASASSGDRARTRALVSQPIWAAKLAASSTAATPWREAEATSGATAFASGSIRPVRGAPARAIASRIMRSSAPRSRARRAARPSALFLEGSAQALASPWQRWTASPTWARAASRRAAARVASRAERHWARWSSADALEFDFADIGQVQRRSWRAGGRGRAREHGGQQGVAEGVGVGGVAEQAVRQAGLGQAIGITCGAAAQRRLGVERAVVLVASGPVQPGLDPDVGPVFGRQHLDDRVRRVRSRATRSAGRRRGVGTGCAWAIPRPGRQGAPRISHPRSQTAAFNRCGVRQPLIHKMLKPEGRAGCWTLGGRRPIVRPLRNALALPETLPDPGPLRDWC